MENLSEYRVAIIGEPSCKTCSSFCNNKCGSPENEISQTWANYTCNKYWVEDGGVTTPYKAPIHEELVKRYMENPQKLNDIIKKLGDAKSNIIIMNNELFQYLESECNEFRNRTGSYYDVEVYDVLYSFFNSTENDFAIYNDWDEGASNDPFWDKELNEHSVIVFLKHICKILKGK